MNVGIKPLASIEEDAEKVFAKIAHEWENVVPNDWEANKTRAMHRDKEGFLWTLLEAPMKVGDQLYKLSMVCLGLATPSEHESISEGLMK